MKYMCFFFLFYYLVIFYNSFYLFERKRNFYGRNIKYMGKMWKISVFLKNLYKVFKIKSVNFWDNFLGNLKVK